MHLQKRKENKKMTMRTPTGHNDARIFRRTAQSIKKVNVSPKPMRGGTRF